MATYRYLIMGSIPVELANSTGMPTPPSPWIISSVVIGLPVTLWTYKCLMMYLFQRKIIYMPYAPINARKDTLDEIPTEFLGGLEVEEVRVPSKGTVLSGIYVRPATVQKEKEPEVIMLYLQGNAGNPLHRLPVFQSLLASHSSTASILAVAPRGYWSSPGRPTQRGITADYLSVLHYALQRWPNARIVTYGHSLGGAAGVCLLSQLPDPSPRSSDTTSTATRSHNTHTSPANSVTTTQAGDYTRIRGLILENPFSSIPGMVRALYPQKWLPYHWMAPFAWDKWDALGALRALNRSLPLLPSDARKLSSIHLPTTTEATDTTPFISPAPSPSSPSTPLAVGRQSVLHRLAPNMLLLLSEHDEIVPREMGEAMWDAVYPPLASADEVRYSNGAADRVEHPERAKEVHHPVEDTDKAKEHEIKRRGKKVIIPHSLHETAWQRIEWKKEVRAYLEGVARDG